MNNSIKRKQYSQINFDEALNNVLNKNMSLRAAAREFGIPVATLSEHKNKKHNSNNIGRKTLLSYEEEELLVSGIVSLANIGVGINHFQISNILQHYQKSNQVRIFNNWTPGRKWFKLFCKRWKQKISIRIRFLPFAFLSLFF